MKKRFLAVFLALVLCLGLAVPAFAAGETTASPAQTDLGKLVATGLDDGIIDQNGTLWVWDSYLKDIPVKAMEDVVSISNNGDVQAIKKDGSLWSVMVWGEDVYTTKLLDNVIASDGDLALKADGTLWSVPAWYDIEDKSATKIMDDVASIYGDLVIKTDKTLWQITRGYYDSDAGEWVAALGEIKVLDDVIHAADGADGEGGTYAAIKSDGSLWMWGSNQWGVLGIGKTEDDVFSAETPVKVMDDVAFVDVDGYVAAAIKIDGSLWMWGYGNLGQVGTDVNNDDGYDTYQSVPRKIMDDVKTVSVAPYSHVAALKTDGTLWTWGYNACGALGNGKGGYDEDEENWYMYTPVKVLDNVAFVDTDYTTERGSWVGDPQSGWTIAVKTDGTVWMWGCDCTHVQTDGLDQSNVPVQIGNLRVNVGHYNSVIAKFPDLKPDGFYVDAVEWAVANGITTGTTATTFAPNENCTHGQILTFLWRAAGSPASNVTLPFATTGEEYYLGAAKWAYEKGMIDKNFNHKTPCTRADAVNYIWQAFGKQSASYDGRFTDVAKNSPYATAVAWALDKGVTTGATATTFNPNGICNRGQIVTFLYRAYK